MRDWSDKNVYYLAISSLQKAVRRGDADYAEWIAKNLLSAKKNLWPVRTRLVTILIEDVGVANVDLMLEFLTAFRKDDESLPSFARRMSESPKSREACDLLVLVTNAWVDQLSAAMKESNEELRRRIIEEELSVAAIAAEAFALKEENDNDDLSEILKDVDVVGAGIAQASSGLQREGMWKFLPLLMKRLSSGDVFVDETHLLPKCERMGDFLSVGLDTHTQVGKICISSFVKRGKFVMTELGSDAEKLKEAFAMLLFAVEGQRVNCRLHLRQTGSKQIVIDAMRSMIPSKPDEVRFIELCQYVSGLIPDFNNLRKWLLEKQELI